MMTSIDLRDDRRISSIINNVLNGIDDYNDDVDYDDEGTLAKFHWIGLVITFMEEKQVFSYCKALFAYYYGIVV